MTASLRVVWLPFLLSRLWVALWVYVGHSQRPFLEPVPYGYAGVPNWWLNPWTLYDSQHFFRLAQVGYEPHTAPFFPLYPLLLRLAGPNEVTMAAWGVVISNAAFLIGLVLLHRLTARDHDATTADRAIWLLAFFPISAVFSAVYTDALFGAWLVAAFWCARREQWMWAGGWAALAALTRNAGPIIFVALLALWVARSGHGGSRVPADATRPAHTHPAHVVYVFLPLLAFSTVELYLAHKFGGALTGVTSHQTYGRALTWPWMPVLRDIWDLITLHTASGVSGTAVTVVTALNVAVTVAAFALVIAHRQRQALPYGILVLGLMVMQLTLGRTFAPYTNSSLRFMATTFPFVQLCALESGRLTRSRRGRVLSGAIYLLCNALLSFYFGEKEFVTG